MSYKADLGGIGGSGVREPNTRPIIDIGGVINAASHAFSNTREGVLHRALLQQAANRAERDDAMKDEQHRLALISAGFRPPDDTQSGQAPAGQPNAQEISGVSDVANSLPSASQGGPPAQLTAPGTAATPASPAAPPSIRLGGSGPNANMVYGGMDLKTQRMMALRRNALQSAQTAHPGMFSPEEVELATHDDKAYDQLISRREKILQGDKEISDREAGLAGGVGPDGKPLSAAMIKALARSQSSYNAYINSQLEPRAPHNIDPLSRAGIDATLELKAAEQKAKGGAQLPAPLAAKVGQFGEMLKKASDLMPATDALNVSLANSAAQDVAAHGVGIGPLHVPGTQGVGSLMVNHSPEYATYQAALSPFVLAAAHALSGARINDTQVQQIRASVEIKPGDSPTVRAQKHKNIVDLMNSIGGSLPHEAISDQEGQMEPTALTLLKSYGYKGTATRSGTDTQPTEAQKLWDASVAKYGEAKVLKEVGARPAR